MHNNVGLPLVSVIIPTYRRPEMIARSIESVLNQTYENIEIIVVDDNPLGSDSHLETERIVRDYPSVKYLKTSGHTGGGAARNLASKSAQGDYLAFLDDDDVYLEDKIERQIGFMIDRDLDFSYHDCALYAVNDKLVDYRRMGYVEVFNEAELLRQHILHSIGPSSVFMVKTSQFLKTDGFGEYCSGQDWFLMLRCIQAGMKMGYLSGSYVKQYLHNGERISLGQNKIIGENNLYEVRKQYFKLFSLRERQYIVFRHYAVLAFSSMRSGMYASGLKYGAVALLTSPTFAMKETIKYLSKD